MTLGTTLQVVVQTETANRDFICEGFSGIPVTHPCYIVIVTDGCPSSLKNAEKLRSAIHREIFNLDSGASIQPVPCKGEISHPNACHAHGNSDCHKLLVLIGDGNAQLPSGSSFNTWMLRGDTYKALPIIPSKAKNNFSCFLHKDFSASNAEFYENDIEETVPVILSAVGLVAEEHRIFISYRRKDTEDLAEQLFDALIRKGFDVFLDRFSIAPALNFQRRLAQELADKSMVLVLESPSFSDSEWTRYEIEFAVKHRLGIFALHTPGGKELNGIDAGSREYLDKNDFDPVKPKALEQSILDRVIARIILEHGRKLTWRRRLLLESMGDALATEGLSINYLSSTGTIHVSTPANYSIHLTTRPPVLGDFHDSYRQSQSAISQGVLVGPLDFQEPVRRQRLDWLGQISKVLCFDEGKMLDVAKGIKGGLL